MRAGLCSQAALRNSERNSEPWARQRPAWRKEGGLGAHARPLAWLRLAAGGTAAQTTLFPHLQKGQGFVRSFSAPERSACGTECSQSHIFSLQTDGQGPVVSCQSGEAAWCLGTWGRGMEVWIKAPPPTQVTCLSRGNSPNQISHDLGNIKKKKSHPYTHKVLDCPNPSVAHFPKLSGQRPWC